MSTHLASNKSYTSAAVSTDSKSFYYWSILVFIWFCFLFLMKIASNKRDCWSTDFTVALSECVANSICF